MKFVTRILALVLVGVMALTLAACHQKDEVVMTVGETAIPAGLYLGFQLEAYQTLMSGVQEQLSASSDAPRRWKKRRSMLSPCTSPMVPA